VVAALEQNAVRAGSDGAARARHGYRRQRKEEHRDERRRYAARWNLHGMAIQRLAPFS
jgi:hypothetical protein